MLCVESWVRIVVHMSIQISGRGVHRSFNGDRLVMAGKMNVDASWRHWIKSTSIVYIMRDNHYNVIMAKSKRIEDCSIVVAECLAMREAILMASQEDIQQIISQSDSQVVVNSISRGYMHHFGEKCYEVYQLSLRKVDKIL